MVFLQKRQKDKVVALSASMQMTKASIILPTKNVDMYIGDLLKNVYRQDFMGDIETIILDSSDDQTPEIAKDFSVKIIHVETEEFNHGNTRNLGAQMAKGTFLVFLSADVIIKDSQWLTKLLEPFKDPMVAGVFSRQYPKKDANPMENFFIQYVYPLKSYVLKMNNQGKILLKDPVFFSTVSAAIRKEVWEKIKLPEMLMSEDQEWAKRTLLAGYKIAYASESVVYHSHNYSLKQVFHRFFGSGATLQYIYHHEKIEQPKAKFIIQGLKYLKAECQYLVRNGEVKRLPYALLYEFMRFLGYFLGTKHKYMPVWLKVMLSNQKNHWKKYNDIVID